MDTNESVPHSVDSRLVRLEGQLAQLLEGMQSVIVDVKQVKQRTDELTSQVEERGRPNWQLIISGASVLMLVLATVGGISMAPLYLSTNKLERAQEEIKSALKEHIDLPLHNGSAVRLATIEQQQADEQKRVEDFWTRLEHRLAERNTQFDRELKDSAEIAELKAKLEVEKHKTDFLEKYISPKQKELSDGK